MDALSIFKTLPCLDWTGVKTNILWKWINFIAIIKTFTNFMTNVNELGFQIGIPIACLWYMKFMKSTNVQMNLIFPILKRNFSFFFKTVKKMFNCPVFCAKGIMSINCNFYITLLISVQMLDIICIPYRVTSIHPDELDSAGT